MRPARMLRCVPTRERFLEFNWWCFIALVAFGVSAWLSSGPWLVLASLGAGGIIAGVWYLFWRRGRKRAA
jgi:hypothetical protein